MVNHDVRLSVVMIHPTKQVDNAKALDVSYDNPEDTSECHFKCWKTKPNPVYYDEANSRPLDVDVFFVDIPIST